MVLTKIKNKIHGYHCDKCKVVAKVVYSNNEGFLCPAHALEKYGQEALDKAELEED